MHTNLRLFRLVFATQPRLILGLFASVLFSSTLPFLQSGSQGLLINNLVSEASRGFRAFLLGDSGLILGVFLATSVAIPLVYILFEHFSKLLWIANEQTLTLAVLKKQSELDIATHEDPAYNNLLRKINEEGNYRARNVSDRHFYILQNLIQIGIAAVIILTIRWWLLIIIFVAALPELIIELRHGNQIWGIASEESEERRWYWELRSHFSRAASLVELKLFQNSPHFLALLRTLFSAFQDRQRVSEERRFARMSGAAALTQLAALAALVFFVFEVLEGRMQIGTLVFYYSSVREFRSSLSNFFSNLGRQYQDTLFVRDLFTFLDIPPALDYARSKVTLAHAAPTIEFRNVSFTYPGSSTPVLTNFSLTIRPGERLALVGVNGAGKTTLVKLLARFYDPSSGTILINGTDLREIDLGSWYSLLGTLFQEYAKYEFVTKDAIAIGRSSETLDIVRVQGAAEASEASGFIEAWEKRYEQMLGKEFTGGVEPSVGQWQKLALARTFYRDPHVLILDEPTASVDAEAEAKIFERLERLPGDRSVILISHRFSTVRHADRIAVIDGGTLIELGSHDELVAKGGTYARLFALQAKGYQ